MFSLGQAFASNFWLLLAIFCVVAVVGVTLAMNAPPQGRERAFLLAAPGEALRAQTVANLRISAQEPAALAALIQARGPADTRTGQRITAQLGAGRWVAGRAFLTTQRFVFLPNAQTREAADAAPALVVPLAAVEAVTLRPGLLTRPLEIKTPGATLVVNGYTGARMAAAMEAAAARPPGAL